MTNPAKALGLFIPAEHTTVFYLGVYNLGTRAAERRRLSRQHPGGGWTHRLLADLGLTVLLRRAIAIIRRQAAIGESPVEPHPLVRSRLLAEHTPTHRVLALEQYLLRAQQAASWR